MLRTSDQRVAKGVIALKYTLNYIGIITNLLGHCQAVRKMGKCECLWWFMINIG